jgi:DNA-directed RNA polymerase sigma subunit (sigma70/sigma32)
VPTKTREKRATRQTRARAETKKTKTTTRERRQAPHAEERVKARRQRTDERRQTEKREQRAGTRRFARRGREADPRGIEPPKEPANAVADVTMDSLQLFFNEARKYPLLTAAQEIELAKRIEKGDMAAKDRMINSNLRLVVSVARK